MSQASTRTHSILMLLLAAAILPAVVGCSETGSLWSVGNGLQYRHEAVLWVYKAGRQYIDPPPSGKNILGLPYETGHSIEGLFATREAGTGRLAIHFYEVPWNTKSLHRIFAVSIDAKTGQGVPFEPEKLKIVSCALECGSSRHVLDPTTKRSHWETEVWGNAGRYTLYEARSPDGGLEVHIGSEGQAMSDCEKLLVYEEHKGCSCALGGQFLKLRDINCLVLSPGGGYLVCIDLSKLPTPVSATTQTAKSD